MGRKGFSAMIDITAIGIWRHLIRAALDSRPSHSQKGETDGCFHYFKITVSRKQKQDTDRQLDNPAASNNCPNCLKVRKAEGDFSNWSAQLRNKKISATGDQSNRSSSCCSNRHLLSSPRLRENNEAR